MNKTKPRILEHHHTIREELICHLPYAIISVALSMIALSILASVFQDPKILRQLFHNFHYLHLLFAGTGTVLIFRKYSPSLIGALSVGFIVPAIFCTLSDSVLPYVGGWYLGLPMHFHWCFISHLSNVLPFLIIGIINGFIMSSHSSTRQIFYSQGSHFLHILISAMASILYLVSYGFTDWHTQMGFVFMFLILAVLIPCTLSDIVVPMMFAGGGDKPGHECADSCENNWDDSSQKPKRD